MKLTLIQQPAPTEAGPLLLCTMKAYVARLRQLGRDGTAANYQAALNSFRCFRAGRDVAMSDIDYILIEDYEAWLRSQRLVPNSIAFYMRILRACYNRAVVNEMIPTDRHPFRTVTTDMERTRKRAISAGDMKRIVDADLVRRPRLAFARDMFLFLFYCRGMSIVDAAFLRKCDMREGVLTYHRRKTNQPLRIKVVPQIRSIVSRYAKPDSPYLLPIIARPGHDERRQYAAALHRINDRLKTLGGMLGIDIPLTTYVARHSWATIAKRQNVSINVISDALGHDSIATTQTYLASIDFSAIDRANDIVIRAI